MESISVSHLWFFIPGGVAALAIILRIGIAIIDYKKQHYRNASELYNKFRAETLVRKRFMAVPLSLQDMLQDLITVDPTYENMPEHVQLELRRRCINVYYRELDA